MHGIELALQMIDALVQACVDEVYMCALMAAFTTEDYQVQVKEKIKKMMVHE